MVDFLANESSDCKKDFRFEFLDIDNLLESFIKRSKSLKIEKLVSDWSIFLPMKTQIERPTTNSDSSTPVYFREMSTQGYLQIVGDEDPRVPPYYKR